MNSEDFKRVSSFCQIIFNLFGLFAPEQKIPVQDETAQTAQMEANTWTDRRVFIFM